MSAGVTTSGSSRWFVERDTAEWLLRHDLECGGEPVVQPEERCWRPGWSESDVRSDECVGDLNLAGRSNLVSDGPVGKRLGDRHAGREIVGGDSLGLFHVVKKAVDNGQVVLAVDEVFNCLALGKAEDFGSYSMIRAADATGPSRPLSSSSDVCGICQAVSSTRASRTLSWPRRLLVRPHCEPGMLNACKPRSERPLNDR
jgi:hypothetical protein